MIQILFFPFSCEKLLFLFKGRKYKANKPGDRAFPLKRTSRQQNQRILHGFLLVWLHRFLCSATFWHMKILLARVGFLDSQFSVVYMCLIALGAVSIAWLLMKLQMLGFKAGWEPTFKETLFFRRDNFFSLNFILFFLPPSLVVYEGQHQQQS